MTNYGLNAVQFAAKFGHLDVLRALQGWNINLNATTNRGWNAVHIAAKYGHLHVLRALQGWNVDLNATTNSGWNAVHIAAKFGHLDVLRALQGWNVDLVATTNVGYNAVHLAAQDGQLDVLRALQGWNIDLNATTNDGYNAVHLAALNDHLPTVQQLILLGAQVRPGDFPASHIEIRQQLMAWADDHLARHRTFISTVLPAIHDDGSHTAENHTNWLAYLAGFREFRVCVSEYLGIRVGAEHRALRNAMEVWLAMG